MPPVEEAIEQLGTPLSASRPSQHDLAARVVRSFGCAKSKGADCPLEARKHLFCPVEPFCWLLFYRFCCLRALKTPVAWRLPGHDTDEEHTRSVARGRRHARRTDLMVCIATFFYPDCNRRPRSLTGVVPCGSRAWLAPYRRSGISPCPESLRGLFDCTVSIEQDGEERQDANQTQHIRRATEAIRYISEARPRARGLGAREPPKGGFAPHTL
jgi:hypothetical protein